MDADSLKYFSQLGSVGILALVFYYQNNKNSIEYARRSEEQAKSYAEKVEALLNIERGRTEMLVRLVTDNTAQTATNSTLMVALHRRLDRDVIDNENERMRNKNGSIS